MSLRYIQKQVDRWARQFEAPYFPPLEISNNLLEEAGEVATELNRRYGHKGYKIGEKPGDLGEEICDAMFPLFCLANSLGIDLQKSWDKMIRERLYRRDNKRFKRKAKRI